MNHKRLRIALVERDERLVDLHRATQIPYNRLVRLVNGYFPPRSDELQVIANAVGIAVEELDDDGE